MALITNSQRADDAPMSAADMGRRDEMAGQIFSVSATLVGACLTVIGLLHALNREKGAGTYADDILTLDALMFVGACLTAYRALRAGQTAHRYHLEQVADRIFFPALVLMMIACVVITYDLV